MDDVALHIHERVSSEYGRPAFSRINGITLAPDGRAASGADSFSDVGTAAPAS